MIGKEAILGLIIATLLFAAGFGVAWTWQAGRHDSYVREQERDLEKRNEAASRQRDETAAAWAANLAELTGRLGTKQGQLDALARCVANGRCSPALSERMLSHCPKGETILPTEKPDGAVAGPVSAGTGAASDNGETPFAGLIQDCGTAVLMLNSLQTDIEKQKGY